MKIKVIIKIMMVLLFLSTVSTSNVKSDLSIDVSVYDGQGGLLIDWSFDEQIIVESVKISSKKIGEASFKTLKEFNFNKGRYLDILCEPNERYYYKIEIIDEDGKIYTSDLNRPSFGVCLGLDNSTLSSRI